MPPPGITPLVEAIYAGTDIAEALNDETKDEADAVGPLPSFSLLSASRAPAGEAWRCLLRAHGGWAFAERPHPRLLRVRHGQRRRAGQALRGGRR